MTTDQTVPVFCPRCGGLMYKPAGSLFYWHATNDHLPCSITNIAEIPDTQTVKDEPLDDQQRTLKK